MKWVQNTQLARKEAVAAFAKSWLAKHAVNPEFMCPDPHFKRRHHKRRIVQKSLVDSIMNNLTLGGQVFVQSDVLEVALDMRSQFDALSNLQHMDAVDHTFHCDPDGWLLSNPTGIRTEREIHAELEGAKIYRRMYQKMS
ncbi:hypothetical protein Ancab_029021 [Ancistrocladus abbreviatus]